MMISLLDSHYLVEDLTVFYDTTTVNKYEKSQVDQECFFNVNECKQVILLKKKESFTVYTAEEKTFYRITTECTRMTTWRI